MVFWFFDPPLWVRFLVFWFFGASDGVRLLVFWFFGFLILQKGARFLVFWFFDTSEGVRFLVFWFFDTPEGVRFCVFWFFCSLRGVRCLGVWVFVRGARRQAVFPCEATGSPAMFAHLDTDPNPTIIEPAIVPEPLPGQSVLTLREGTVANMTCNELRDIIVGLCACKTGSHSDLLSRVVPLQYTH